MHMTRRTPRAGTAIVALLTFLSACGTGQEVRTAPPSTGSTTSLPDAGSPSTVAPATSSSTSSTTTSTAPTTTTTPPTTSPPTTTPPTTVPPTPRLEPGDEGAAVRQLQQQLDDLRFWVGPIDGIYGWLTKQAVFAFQSANGLSLTGEVDGPTRDALDDPQVPGPRSGQGQVMEIDKARQLIYVVDDGRLEWVFHTSTGTEKPYQHPDGYTATADTPPGRHEVFYQVDGVDPGSLGPLHRPIYFHEDGIAVHGYDHVPPYPASHGCVRVTKAAMDYIWANGLMPMGSTVLVYGQPPTPGPAV